MLISAKIMIDILIGCPPFSPKWLKRILDAMEIAIQALASSS